jgi:hypothetical protein
LVRVLKKADVAGKGERFQEISEAEMATFMTRKKEKIELKFIVLVSGQSAELAFFHSRIGGKTN